MKAFRALSAANIKAFMRDRMGMFWTLAFPVFFILIFGMVFSGGGQQNYSLGVAIEDQSPVAQQIGHVFKQVSVFEVYQGTLQEELDQMKQGHRSAVVVAPAGMADSIARGEQAKLQVYYDPAQTTTSQVVLSIIDKVVQEMDRQITNRPVMLSVEQKTVQVQNLRTIDFLVPGILAMALMQLGIFASAPLVSLREKGVLKRLGATPLPRSQFVSSQVLLRVIIAIVQTGLIIFVGRAVFNVQMVGNWLELLGMVLLGALAFTSVGYVVAAFAKTEESAIMLMQVINFPMMFLSGIFFPIEMMPNFIRPVMDILPLTYLADGLRQIMTNASALHPMWMNAAVMAVWLVVAFTVSVRFFRWEQQ